MKTGIIFSVDRLGLDLYQRGVVIRVGRKRGLRGSDYIRPVGGGDAMYSVIL